MADKQNAPQILYAGHSCVIVTSLSGKRIVIDPWLDGNPLCPLTLYDPGKVDYLILSHGHSDHTGSAISLAKKYGATVFATYELAMLLIKDGIPENQVQMMNKGGSFILPDGKGLAVTLTNAFHSSSYDASDGKTYYAGEPCGVVLTLESGKNIYHAGDTCLFSDMTIIRELYNPEIVMLPIGDRFTMGPKTAAHAVRLLKPRIAIPIHYATFEMLTGTPDMFQQEVKGLGLSTEVVALLPGEAMVIAQ